MSVILELQRTYKYRLYRCDKRDKALHQQINVAGKVWKRLDGNKIRIGAKIYKYVQHRDLCGQVKTLTIKRDRLQRLWLCFSTVEKLALPDRADTSRIGGFDFGLRTFLTDHSGRRW